MAKLLKFIFLMILITSAPSAFCGYALPNGGYIFTRAGYNYGPSTIVEGNIQKFWWCGLDQGPSGQTDTIQYRTYNSSTQQWSTITKVLTPTTGAWDSLFTCDPSVIAGNFKNPENGLTYQYAMYYTATNTRPGINNSIGLAYSNDGVNWVKYSQPVIRQAQVDGGYGAGQAATYNANGQANIYVFYTDTSAGAGDRLYLRQTNDGINFGAATLISDSNTAGLQLSSNSDLAYDYNSKYFYAVRETAPYRSGDREAYQMIIARMPASDLLSGGGTWEVLGFANSNLTGFYMNHNPGIWRDNFGNITNALPTIPVYFAAGTNDSNTWNLTTVSITPTPSTLLLTRYACYTCGNNNATAHLITVGYVPNVGYHVESTLGYLDMAPISGEIPLYNCMAGKAPFLTKDQACEGQQPMGIMGYISPNSGGNTRAIYRCVANNNNIDHFVSYDAACEGQKQEGLLGYSKNSQ